MSEGFVVGCREELESYPAYTYQPLSATQIRLFTVDEEDHGATVSGQFQIVRLEPGGHSQPRALPKWEAVSYAWEGQIPSHSVSLGSHHLKVTDNVLQILRDLRLRTEKRTVWIDAICINQDDREEKSHQVSLMQQIYTLAERVIIWLPLYDKTGHKDKAESSIFATQWLLRIIEMRQDWSLSDNLCKSFMIENPQVRIHGAFHDVLSRSWFGRMWVVQEAVLAQRLSVHLGSVSIPWESYSLSILRFMSNLDVRVAVKSSANECYHATLRRDLSTAIKVGAIMVHLIIQLRTIIREAKHSIQPSELLLLCGPFKASVPCDNVYAVAGLFGIAPIFAHQANFTLDYRKPHLSVYEDFTVWCIENEGNLDVLAQQRNECGRQHYERDFVSWSTDWSHTTEVAFTTRGSVVPINERNASMAIINQHSPLYRSVSTSLFLKGYVIDIVVSGFVASRDFKKEDMLDWLKDIPDDEEANLVLFGEKRPTVDSLVNVYQETFRKAQSFTHLWRDGDTAAFGKGNIFEEFRGPMRTKRGCLAITFPYFDIGAEAKICAFYGGRALFIVLQERKGDCRDQRHRLVCGDCFINGFEDGKGIAMARKLGLQEQEIRLV